jgi:DNA-binding NarL/FixJ family response regulator
MKIAIIEDNIKFMDSLALGLSIFDDCNVIHKLNNALHISQHFNEETPDVAIVDINMPGLTGIDALKEISTHFENVQCVMLTVNVDLNMVIKCLQHGAKGYLIKDKDPIQKIVESLRILHHGNYTEEFPLNGALANRILNHFLAQQKTIDKKLEAYLLTPRQTEILKMLYDGKSYKMIAADCNISMDTLNSHIRAIYPKLNINSRGEIRTKFEN